MGSIYYLCHAVSKHDNASILFYLYLLRTIIKEGSKVDVAVY